MGEAKRRRDNKRARAQADKAAGERRARERAWMDRIASEDPDDREIRKAHGFTYDDDWRDETLLCRNGCGLPYSEVVAGKVRACSAEPPVVAWMRGRFDDDFALDKWQRDTLRRVDTAKLTGYVGRPRGWGGFGRHLLADDPLPDPDGLTRIKLHTHPAVPDDTIVFMSPTVLADGGQANLVQVFMHGPSEDPADE